MKSLKSTIYIMLVFLLPMTGCEDESSAGLSRVTYFPDFTYNGDALVFVEKGTAFDDPGVTATEQGNTIPVDVSASGMYFGETSLDTSNPDIYTVTYAATNQDGFEGTQSRTVIVAGQGDLVSDLEGLYTSTVVRNGVSGAAYTDMEYVVIRKIGDNEYELSDGIGGYYDLGRAYGPTYAAQPATFTANNIATNDFTFGPTFAVGTFGGEVELTAMTVNAASKTITFKSVWEADATTEYTFNVTLKQVEF
jgi:hypothetical protein